MKINILYSLDVEGSPSISVEDRKIQDALDTFFKPLDKKLLNFLPQKNMDLTPDAIRVLLQREPTLKAGMEGLTSGNGKWEDIVALKGVKLNGMEVISLVARASIDANISFLDYLNHVFGTHVTPETTISINGGTMSIRNAIIYNFKKSTLVTRTQGEIQGLKK